MYGDVYALIYDKGQKSGNMNHILNIVIQYYVALLQKLLTTKSYDEFRKKSPRLLTPRFITTGK